MENISKTDQTQAVLELRGLTKYFGSRCAVNNISLSVNKGEVFGFIGPNGAGKTTTIRMIVGLAAPTLGDISICGYSLKRDYEQALSQIGGIIENPELYDYLSGYQNLKLFAGLYKGITKQQIDEVIHLVGLENRIGDRLKKYSLGMRQRLGIAQSLLHNPKVLIFDEPTNGLDPAGIHEMRDLFRRLASEKGVAIFVSSHILSEMQLMCDRAAIIDKGDLVKIINIDEFSAGENTRYIIRTSNPEAAVEQIKKAFEIEASIKDGDVILEAGEETIAKIISALVRVKIDIFMVKPISLSLEEAFLSATSDSKIS